MSEQSHHELTRAIHELANVIRQASETRGLATARDIRESEVRILAAIDAKADPEITDPQFIADIKSLAATSGKLAKIVP